MSESECYAQLKEGNSVIVVNSLTINTIPFLMNHQHELVPIAKPQGTTAKAYRYVNPAQKENDVGNIPFHCRLRFLQSPDWNHHQGQAFNVAIDINGLYKIVHELSIAAKMYDLESPVSEIQGH